MVQHLKNPIRKEMLAKRAALSGADVASLSEKICDRIVKNSKFKKAKFIGFYLAKGNEANLKKAIVAAFALGKEVLVPITTDQIHFYHLSSFDDLHPGKFGILEPKTKIKPCIEPDLVIVPGVAFGECMHRLGYGKGYYDRYFSKVNPAASRVGVCYDFQVVEKLPTHEEDQKLDEIITEKRVIKA
ncbi:5-formyltetrahydrofolate cyclo-ligase [Candidatus Micrarchaeota archaeon]|nr:5-formyltetrahydrofolate cyclo-ligase [Candidatus Micrarchaeota archaeon]